MDGISNKDQIWKAKRFILSDLTKQGFDDLIKDAIISANREINDLGGVKPLAWNREVYDEIFTRYYAQISAITQASPGVITAETVDPDVDDNTGFSTNDIVYISSVNGMERLNDRLYLWERITDTTGKLKTLDGQSEIDTSGYEEYDSGGHIYHAGIILPHSTIQPSNSWTIRRVYDVLFDMQPGCNPISEAVAKENGWIAPGGRPRKWRYQQYTYSTFTSSNRKHYLFWYKFPSQRYNCRVLIEKSYPDISTWGSSNYPYLPVDLHDFVWHRALANLATHAEKQKRRSTGIKDGVQGDNTKIEILHANYWINKRLEEETKILAYNRTLLGQIPYINEGMSA